MAPEKVRLKAKSKLQKCHAKAAPESERFHSKAESESAKSLTHRRMPEPT